MLSLTISCQHRVHDSIPSGREIISARFAHQDWDDTQIKHLMH